MEGTPLMKKILLFSMFLCVWVFSFFAVSKVDAAEKKKKSSGIRIDFTTSFKRGKSVSGGWHYKGKPFTKDIDFSIVELDGVKVLKVASRKSSGTILYDLSTIDLAKYPIMRWKWMAVRLPRGACATNPRKDDQVLAICAGAGRPRTNSVAFRWETKTKKGRSGYSRYGLGMVQVNWFALRNQEDKLNTWYVEEVDLQAHLKRLFPRGIPEKDLALSITGNSQYTATDSIGYVEYLEFLPASEKGKLQ